MIRVGTSGWVYGDWRERFYPKGVAQKRWLSYYAERFDTVELNATTYRLPKEHQVRIWCETVPPNFRYTVKLSRLITHRKTLPARVDEFIENYMARAACFEEGKVAQILVQFPPFLERDDAHLEAFLDKLPRHHRYVVEFRHKSWLVPQVEALLRERQIALCIHDYPGFRMRDIVTSGELAYVRLHGYEGLYVGSYPKRSLQRWARRVEALAAQARDVYVYFNNDTKAAAPFDARRLRDMLKQPASERSGA
jgi:uncharacterized protein YecE (DUF72 family)